MPSSGPAWPLLPDGSDWLWPAGLLETAWLGTCELDEAGLLRAADKGPAWSTGLRLLWLGSGLESSWMRACWAGARLGLLAEDGGLRRWSAGRSVVGCSPLQIHISLGGVAQDATQHAKHAPRLTIDAQVAF